jgi:hypothetical protein
MEFLPEVQRDRNLALCGDRDSHNITVRLHGKEFNMTANLHGDKERFLTPSPDRCWLSF